MTFEEDNKPTLEDFKRAAGELVTNLEGKTIEQLEAGQHCLNVIYLNLSQQDCEMAVRLGVFDWANGKVEQKIFELEFDN